MVYLMNNNVKFILPFKIAYIAAIAVAPYLSLKPIWLLADITNACMAFPNLVGLLGLSSVVVAETRAYFKEYNRRRLAGEDINSISDEMMEDFEESLVEE